MRQKRKGLPAALVYWPHSEEGEGKGRGIRNQREEGGRKKGKGSRRGGKRNRHEVNSYTVLL